MKSKQRTDPEFSTPLCQSCKGTDWEPGIYQAGCLLLNAAFRVVCFTFRESALLLVTWDGKWFFDLKFWAHAWRTRSNQGVDRCVWTCLPLAHSCVTAYYAMLNYLSLLWKVKKKLLQKWKDIYLVQCWTGSCMLVVLQNFTKFWASIGWQGFSWDKKICTA